MLILIFECIKMYLPLQVVFSFSLDTLFPGLHIGLQISAYFSQMDDDHICLLHLDLSHVTTGILTKPCRLFALKNNSMQPCKKNTL